MKKLPYWDELPDLDLYLDQVLLYVNQFHPNLTAAMINNYVKHRYLAKPIKKKYQKHQLARLIAMTHLKSVFAIQDISQTLAILLKKHSSKTLYNSFVACMNDEAENDNLEVIRQACQTLKSYHLTQTLTLQLKGDDYVPNS